MTAARCCDFCGRFQPTTVQSAETAHVICSSRQRERDLLGLDAEAAS